jgi:transcriptional regulator with XRE-family HTH domain
MANPLRELREKQGWSQADLAALSGVDRGTIIDLELGRRKPRPSTRRKLAVVLGVRPDRILFRRAERTSYY